MKRRLRQLLLLLALGLLTWAGWRLAWLTSTSDGARWILQAITEHTGVRLTAQRVDGSLFDHLVLQGVELRVAQVAVAVDRLELELDKAPLALGRLESRSAVLQGVRIQDQTPRSQEPTVLAWPKVSGLLAALDLRIARLQAASISYRRLDGPPLEVTDLATSAQWRNGALTLGGLALAAPAGTLTGSASAAFRQPGLAADLALALPRPLAGMDRYSAQLRMSRGGGTELLAGLVKLTGALGAEARWQLNGRAGLARDAVHLRGLTLSQPGTGGQVTGEGRLDLAAPEPHLALSLKADQLDLGPSLDIPTRLTGTLTATGSLERFQGQASLANAGPAWQAATLAGSFEGSRSGLRIGPLTGTFLDGSLQGRLDLDWQQGLALRGELHASQLNPARLAPAWNGAVNLSLAGRLDQPTGGPRRSELTATLLESRLHGQALTGGLRLRETERTLQVEQLDLLGKGFTLKASGPLDRRLEVAAEVADLALLVPGAAGKVHAAGWLRWRDGAPGGSLDGQVRGLSLGGTRIASGELRARTGADRSGSLAVAASVHRLQIGCLRAEAATLRMDGTLLKHTAEATLRGAQTQAQVALAGAFEKGVWRGELLQLSGTAPEGAWRLAAPAQVKVGAGSLALAPLALVGTGTERLDLAADLTWSPLQGSTRLEWTGLNLARLGPCLAGMNLTGSSQGSLQVAIPAGRGPTLSGRATAQGTVTREGQDLAITRGELHLEGGAQGLAAGFSLRLGDGAEVSGQLDSTTPARLGLPEGGQVKVDWKGIDLALLQPWLPKTLKLDGRLDGRAQGDLEPGSRFSLTGAARVSQGGTRWKDPNGEISTRLKQASASWTWQGEALRGDLEVELAEHGRVEGRFQLPIPARLPLAVHSEGLLQAALDGKVQEKGLLTALFPGLLQESHGNLEARLGLGGTWAAPRIEGELSLTRAGAYLPSAGIRVEDLQLSARLENDTIRIAPFRAVSGGGALEGTALLRLKGWRVASYEGTLTGDRFQTIFFPELQVRTSPRLSFQGQPGRLAVRGEIRIPELQVQGTQTRAVVTPSQDAVVLGRAPVPRRTSTLALDVQVSLLLGDRVQISVGGIEAQLGGGLELAFDDLEKIGSKGEIRVLKGRIKTHNVNLDIVRGRVYYGGGPLDQPTLDFLALRTINEIKAGVTVGGTLQAPVIKLYSEPALPEVDVLGYIVIGHPISNGEQAGIASKAAGMLLSAGQLGEINSKLQSRLGISAEIQADSRLTSNTMGYAPVQTNAPGQTPASMASTQAEAMLTVGKYLTPSFYVSYGKSLSTGSALVRMRYDMSKRWQVESQSGDESGLDIYYKVEFK